MPLTIVGMLEAVRGPSTGRTGVVLDLYRDWIVPVLYSTVHVITVFPPPRPILSTHPLVFSTRCPPRCSPPNPLRQPPVDSRIDNVRRFPPGIARLSRLVQNPTHSSQPQNRP